MDYSPTCPSFQWSAFVAGASPQMSSSTGFVTLAHFTREDNSFTSVQPTCQRQSFNVQPPCGSVTLAVRVSRRACQCCQQINQTNKIYTSYEPVPRSNDRLSLRGLPLRCPAAPAWFPLRTSRGKTAASRSPCLWASPGPAAHGSSSLPRTRGWRVVRRLWIIKTRVN